MAVVRESPAFAAIFEAPQFTEGGPVVEKAGMRLPGKLKYGWPITVIPSPKSSGLNATESNTSPVTRWALMISPVRTSFYFGDRRAAFSGCGFERQSLIRSLASPAFPGEAGLRFHIPTPSVPNREIEWALGINPGTLTARLKALRIKCGTRLVDIW